MFDVEPVNSTCPYCGEPIELLVDSSVRKQNYIEDCQVCCRPISVANFIPVDSDTQYHLNSLHAALLLYVLHFFTG